MDLEDELKHFIVEALMLEDVNPDDIDPESPLFNEGLGLDSIDALELATAINKRYGVRITASDNSNNAIFRNLRSLAAYVAARNKPAE
ncbi:MAG: acyl carrier protein [Myxococcales bacterium]|nr:acyl carrier protein [Myxococcales bacterium]MCB9708887.1 acyl carrier protein [Myxococcales bacterium]